MLAAIEDFRRSLEGRSVTEIIDIAVSIFSEKEELENQLSEFRNASTDMAIQYQQMKDELKGARKEIDELRKQIVHLTGINTIQTNDLYGRSTEKTEEVLDRVVNGNLPEIDPLSEDASDTDEDRNKRKMLKDLVSQTDGVDAGERPRRKRMDLSGLPVQNVYDYDFDEYDEKYGKGNWRIAFWNKTVTVEVKRQISYVKNTMTPILSVGVEHVLFRTSHGNELIPKSVVSPSLLAQLMYDRNRMYLPLYRQESDSERFGFYLSRQTMSNWINYATLNYLKLVFEYLRDTLITYEYQHCDETYYLVITGKGSGSKGYVWVHRSGELTHDNPIVVYFYEDSRSTGHLRRFYEGIDHKIILTCDAYSAYSCYADESDGLVVLSGCLMHLRRKIVDAIKVIRVEDLSEEAIMDLPEVKALMLIGDIFHTEKPLKDLSPEERYLERQEKVKPCVGRFFDFIHSLNINDLTFSDKFKDAIRYADNQETYLRAFLNDGNIPVHNGSCELSVKSVALYRRNSLFSFTHSGAESTMIISSLVETARANGADPYWYLKYLLEKMPGHIYDKNSDYLPNMMPWSDAYRAYEVCEKQNSILSQAPPGNEKPKTPVKGQRKTRSA